MVGSRRNRVERRFPEARDESGARGRARRRYVIGPRAALAITIIILAVSILAGSIAQPLAAGTILLRDEIDQLLDGSHAGPVAPPAGDAVFLRRLYLDLTGRIPTAEEARGFLDDPAPEKRGRLIEKLLSSPEHARRLQWFFDVTLMERRGEKHVKAREWQDFLYASFLENKPYNRLVGEILGADGADPATRAAARFFLDRDGDLHRLTRDVGRLFFGRDLQCAQCHDHPLVSEYAQAEYYGIYAFLTRSYVFTDKEKKEGEEKPLALVAEKAEGEVTYKSVFEPDGETRTASPRLPGGATIVEPVFEKGSEYVVAPAENVRPVPRSSRREALARLAAEGQDPWFAQNIANRLWALVMGRGIVEPPDLHHRKNPPTHARLLLVLAEKLATSGYDIRAFLREVVSSRAYQRESIVPESPVPESIVPPAPPGAGKDARDTEEKGVAGDVAARLGALRAEDERLAAAGKEAARGAEEALAALAGARAAVDEALKRSQEAGAAQAARRLAAEAALAHAAALERDTESKAKAVGLLAEAAAKAREAQAALAGDAAVGEALVALERRSEVLAKDLESLRAAREEGGAARAAAAAELVAAESAAGAAGAALAAAKEALEKATASSEARGREAALAQAAALEAREAVRAAEALGTLVGTRPEVSAAPAAAAAPPAEDAERRVRLGDLLRKRFAVAELKPLGPEELAWSLMQALGMVASQRRAEEEALRKELEKEGRSLSPDELERALEKAVHGKLSGNEGGFVSLLGGLPGEPPGEFQATAQAALFFANGDVVRKWLEPGGGSLGERLLKLASPAALAEELYLSLLSRGPSTDEAAEVEAYLVEEGAGGRAALLEELIWALLTSAEFRFNH
jgi:hypothetical protein